MGTPLLPRVTGVSPSADEVDAYLDAGDAHFDAANYIAAIAAYEAGLALDPNRLSAKYNLGTALLRLGRRAEAVSAFRAVLTAKPDFAAAAYNLAVVLHEDGKLVEAEFHYRQSIAASAEFAAAHRNFGSLLRMLGRHTEALAAINHALALEPANADAHLERGITLRQMGRLDEAIVCFEKATNLRPAYRGACVELGDCYEAAGRRGAAIMQYRVALRENPRDFDALNHLGVALQALGEADEAAAILRRAVELRPTDFLAHTHLGGALAMIGRPYEALHHCRQAVLLAPGSALAWCNLGSTLHELSEFDEAIECFEQAVVLNPAFIPGHTHQAITRLLRGDYVRGWEEYEWRLRAKAKAPHDASATWDGQEDLAGKTLLLRAEQGLGDTIQFCRYIAVLSRARVRAIVEIPPVLHRLVRESFPDVDIIQAGGDLPVADAHLSLLSVPFVLGTSVATIPAAIPYLTPPQALIDEWRNRLPADDGMKVGLVWAGNAASANDRTRSITFSRFRRLLDLPNIHFVILQREIPTNDLHELDSCANSVRLGERAGDFADTAAIIAGLDLVISVDTSVAHLAGAMGKPVWILLPFVPDWRWLLGRADSPWYPTARLFRQPSHGDWASVIEMVELALRAWRVARDKRSP